MIDRATLYDIAFHYSQFYFITIATTLGVGVLALPITLADSGLGPFIISIFIAYFVQVLSVLFFTDVLQKAYYHNVDNLKTTEQSQMLIHVDNQESSTYGSEYDIVAERVNSTDTLQKCLPNLYSLAKFLLPYFLPYVFTVFIFFQIMILLVSYGLAGSQAFATLFHLPYVNVIAGFCWILAFIVLLFYPFIQSIISALTFIKTMFFTITIILTLSISTKIQTPSTEEYGAIGDSFLMSAIAMCGVTVLMPLMFTKVKQTKQQMIGFNIAIILGLTTCLILNILWCWAILDIVPQHSVCLPNYPNSTSSTIFQLLSGTKSEGQCILSASLEQAAHNGEISTVPLSKILRTRTHKNFTYISILIEVFVMISISASFITYGSALYQTIKGIVDSYFDLTADVESKYKGILKYFTKRRIIIWLLALISFAIVFIVAFYRPKGFKVILEQVENLIISFTMGIFFAIMNYKVSLKDFRSYEIPFRLPSWFVYLQYIIPVYFICNVAYNIYVITSL